MGPLESTNILAGAARERLASRATQARPLKDASHLRARRLPGRQRDLRKCAPYVAMRATLTFGERVCQHRSKTEQVTPRSAQFSPGVDTGEERPIEVQVRLRPGPGG
jgi:hypothetical protein